ESICYDAACAAARAGCGEGMGADKLSEAERSRRRRQAQECLRQNLAVWEQRCRSDNTGEKAWGNWTMRYWLNDANLAGVRQTERLAGLPAEERAGWAKLWADVQRLADLQK